jgi:hypothetical protein
METKFAQIDKYVREREAKRFKANWQNFGGTKIRVYDPVINYL